MTKTKTLVITGAVPFEVKEILSLGVEGVGGVVGVDGSGGV